MRIPQRKLAILTLVLYWPALIVLAHIPIPASVRSAHVSDKSLHFLAYLVLTFLLWFSLKPKDKVKWGKFKVWGVLFGLTAYGAIDEIIQSHIGRTCDIMDLAANVAGIFFCLLLLTFLSFIPAALLISGIVIFGIANVAKTNLAESFPIVYSVFHFVAYSIFTSFWIFYMNNNLPRRYKKLKWLILAVGIPLCFLVAVRISSFYLGRGIDQKDFIFPIAAILTVITARYLRLFIMQEFLTNQT